MSTPPLSRGMKMLELSGMTHLCKGLVVVLVTAYILIHLFPSALTYLALVPAIYMPLSGFHGVISGFLVGIKQIIPDQELPFLKMKMKWLPSITLLCLIAMSFWTLKAMPYLPNMIFGTYMSWIYLRYWQNIAETKHRGDPSEDFRFSTFFPEFLREKGAQALEERLAVAQIA